MKNSIEKVYIEISGTCNAKCPYCVQNRLKRKNCFGGIMPLKLFSQIVDHLIKIKAIPKNRVIDLYNWGEPFLNPEINEILKILKRKNLKAGLSSNFIYLPDINKQFLSVINNIIFSLSGFSQKSYGKIHGASLDKVLNNFEELYRELRNYSPGTSITIAWHRYLFNENEFWKAHKYFNRPGIFIEPVIAYLNDGIKFRDYLRKELSEEDISKVKQDMFIDRINKDIIYHKRKSRNYHCPQWNYITISESGQLLLCCGFTKYDSDYVLGNILNMSFEEIISKRLSNFFCAVCAECIFSGQAHFVHNSNTAFPAIKDLYSLKHKIYYKCYRFIAKYAFLVKKLPFGEKFIYTVKRLK